jgi:quinol---cytochrome c reductase iron-sulfur subunit, bacillus type
MFNDYAFLRKMIKRGLQSCADSFLIATNYCNEPSRPRACDFSRPRGRFGTVLMGAALSVPLLRFALHPLLTKTTEIGWSDVGKIDEFASLTAPAKRLIKVEQRDAWRRIISEKAVYVLPPKDGTVRILSPICPHLGCSIPWNEAKQEFICPCHVAVFAMNGTKISGPAPRSMDDLDSKVEEGMLKVRYQYFRQLIPTKEPLS